ncbi:MAG: hypothetical protein WC631_02450 [Candidatus Paceibacterota bacterium]|jgi:hypothetical protein
MDNQNNNNQIDPNNQKTAIKKVDASLIFGDDSYGLFIYKKTERLVAGIYLLTNYLSDREALKWNLRESANTLLFKVLALSDRVWGEDGINKEILVSIGEMFSMLNITKISSMISEVNYVIITNEFDKLAEFISSSSKNMSSAKIAFGSNLFDGDYNFIPTQTYQGRTLDGQKGLAGNSGDFYKGQKDIKDNHNSSVFNKMTDMKKSPTEKNIKDKDNRQNIIVSMLKSGLHLTIKDFAQNIKDCSEKTIQRELLALVLKGVLKKEGERRWSKYYLS